MRDPKKYGFITYDNPASTAAKKVTYALSTKQLGGVFMWELSQDYNGQTQPLMDAMYGAFAQAARARAGGRGVEGRELRLRATSRSKASGQECPTHTSDTNPHCNPTYTGGVGGNLETCRRFHERRAGMRFRCGCC